MNLPAMRSLVRRDLKDEDASNYRWTDEELDRHIDHAVREFSLALPREAVAVLTTAAASRELSLATLSDRVVVEAVEYPRGKYPPIYVQFSVWGDTLTLLVDNVPAAGEEAAVFYGRLHTLDNTTSTLPPHLEEVVARGAEGFACQEWANFAVNRVNTGGAGTWREYLTLGQEKLGGLHGSAGPLRQEGRHPHPAALPPRRAEAFAEHGLGSMRLLPSSLLQAQLGPSRRPYMEVKVRDQVAGVARLQFERLYSGSGFEYDGIHAAAMPGDGSLVRGWVRTYDTVLRVSRTPNPGPGSDFGAWQSWGLVNASGIAIASLGSEVLGFYTPPGEQRYSVYYRQSLDNGQTFGSPVSLGMPAYGFPVRWLAAGHTPGGDVAVFAALYLRVFCQRRVGGTWTGVWTDANGILADVSGLATWFRGDWNMVLSGTDSSGKKGVWTYLFGEGDAQPRDTSSALQELALASASSQVEFRCPFLAHYDVYRLFFVEKYNGVGNYSRPYRTHSLPGASFQSNLWREPVPFNLASEYGVAVAPGSGAMWLSVPDGVWRSSPAPEPLDLAPNVVGLVATAEPFRGGLKLELDNSQGLYNSMGTGVLRQGSELAISPGYYTSTGPQASEGPAYWIAGWEHVAGKENHMVVHAEDGWGLLERWRARNQFTWKGTKNVLGLLAFILARAGLTLSPLDPSTFIQGHMPDFTIHPGEKGSWLVAQLMARVPDGLFFRGSSALVKELDPGEAISYSYGAGHPVLQGRYLASAPPGSWVQALGKGVLGEDFDWERVELLTGGVLQLQDLNLTQAGQAQQRAQAQLARWGREASSGEITVPAHCGQELYDVVDVTDPRAGLEAVRRRVSGLTLTYQPRQGLYQHRLLLGGV